MDYIQAVELARKGKEEGFNFLYEETYKSKYYLALKYMKNEETAKDVLQDAYIKAFTKLDTLESPEVFSGWLGMIVANTAKNALQKKNPMLFTDIAVDEEEESFEYEIEDEDLQNRPEVAYTRQETQELVHELLDALPEEQRMCILMFHIEGQSIREIAQTLDCSENTVKSRLNYGRKSIKAKAEELQKKGYTLYNVAPISLLIYLISSERNVLSMGKAFRAAGSIMAQNISQAVKLTGHEAVQSGAGTAGTEVSSGTAGTGGAGTAVNTGAKAAATAGKGLLQTMAGKVTVTVLGICVAAGGAAAAARTLADREQPAAIVSELDEDAGEDELDVETSEAAEEEFLPVTDDMYPELLKGNLTKEEFALILGRVPEMTEESGLSVEERSEMCLYLAFGEGENWSALVEEPSGDEPFKFSADEFNRIFSVAVDDAFTEAENDDFREVYPGIQVEGNAILIAPITPAVARRTSIISAVYNSKEMKVEYEVEEVFWDPTVEREPMRFERTALLRRTESGKYQIAEIQARSSDEEEDKEEAEYIDPAWKEAYLNYVENAPYREYMEGYALIYVDDDRIPELVEISGYGFIGDRVLNYYDGEVRVTEMNCSYPTYIEFGNQLCYSGGHMDAYYDLVYSIIDGEMTIISSGYYGAEDNSNVQYDDSGEPIYQYEFDGVEMSKEEYERAFARVYDKSQAKEGYTWNERYSLDELRTVLENWD